MGGEEKKNGETFALEQLETGEKTTVQLAEHTTEKCPRHTVGCTPYECHGALMEKHGFGAVSDADSPGKQVCYEEAVAFLTQYAHENDGAYFDIGGLDKRLERVKKEVDATGTYVQTYDEVEYGCRLAWRNSGRCIMRKVSFTLELRDSRHITTAEEMYEDVLEHFHYAANGGAIKPVISVYPPKTDGKSAPVRIWNPQLIGYAAYKRPDGSIMGDPARLDITALAIKYGWNPPADKDKSDFDLLPLVISDEKTGHDKPKVFPLLPEHVLEVPIEHPEYAAFADLNLRWYALPAIANIGVDIGGVFYQTCPFNGWYAVTEIGRDFLDKQRYDLATAVSIVCNIPRTTLAVWKDDVQLQVHKAILHSFAKHSVSIVDHHTASNSFQEFYQNEIKLRGKCPADWVWLVPPAGGSMTSVFHQEMFNFIQKPQYRLLTNVWDDLGIPVPAHATIELSSGKDKVMPFSKAACIYDNIIVAYGSETGTSLKYANIVAGFIGDHCTGPLPLDEVPALMALYSGMMGSSNLLLVVTSTFGKGCAPGGATKFISELDQLDPVSGVDFAVLALGNSAYVNSFVNFALEASDALKKAGYTAALPMKVADELKNQDDAFIQWEKSLYGDLSGVLYSKTAASETIEDIAGDAEEKMELTYTGTAALTKDVDSIIKELDRQLLESYNKSWACHSGTLLRSTDLFSFKAKGFQTLDYLMADSVQPGDHIALFPKNQADSVENVLRLCSFDDQSKIDEYRSVLTKDVDLCRPVVTSAIQALLDECNHAKGRKVLELIISNSESTSNDPNDTDNRNPMIEELVTLLPPGSIPLSWVLGNAPSMMPRFFSISSINEDEVTITQSAFHFAHSNKAGTTSKWLRLGLRPGDTVECMFSTTDFHMPPDESSPVIMIAAGSGIAPFRSFWMAKKKNPMHLFFGTQRETDVPFKSELKQLEENGRLVLYPAYSRGSKAQYVQDRLTEEAETVRGLLRNPGTTIYVCGTPSMEYSIRERLISIIGGSIVKATMALARMKVQGYYIAEVYGKAVSGASVPMGKLWDECLSSTIAIASSLDRVGAPKPRAVLSEKKTRARAGRGSVLGRASGTGQRMRLTVMPVATRDESWGSVSNTGLTNSVAKLSLIS